MDNFEVLQKKIKVTYDLGHLDLPEDLSTFSVTFNRVSLKFLSSVKDVGSKEEGAGFIFDQLTACLDLESKRKMAKIKFLDIDDKGKEVTLDLSLSQKLSMFYCGEDSVYEAVALYMKLQGVQQASIDARIELMKKKKDKLIEEQLED